MAFMIISLAYMAVPFTSGNLVSSDFAWFHMAAYYISRVDNRINFVRTEHLHPFYTELLLSEHVYVIICTVKRVIKLVINSQTLEYG